jgi:hypothetical protein
MVGSSGRSYSPHLHFELRGYGSILDPFAGPCRPGESLWKEQPPHVIDQPAGLVDAGVSTVFPTWNRLLDRPLRQTHVQRLTEPQPVYLWVKLKYIDPQDVSRFVLRYPDGYVWEVERTHTRLYGLSTWLWRNWLPSSEFYDGTWTLEYWLNGEKLAELPFTYGPREYDPPEVFDRTVPVKRVVAKGQLAGAGTDANIQKFEVVSPPEHGSLLLHGPMRSHFTYIADTRYQGPDEFSFRALDPLDHASEPATVTLNVHPAIGTALRLEGQGAYAVAPVDPDLFPEEALTVEGLVRRGAGSAGGQPIVHALGARSGFQLFIDPSSRLVFRIGDGRTVRIAYGSKAVPIDDWVHVAAVWDGTHVQLFQDRSPDGLPVPFSGPVSGAGVQSASIGRMGNDILRGELADLRVWSVALPLGRPFRGVGCPVGDEPEPPGSLLAWWRFLGNLDDSSEYGRHAEFVGDGLFFPVELPHDFVCPNLDTDGDGVFDAWDRCPVTPDPGQLDVDSDTVGDACDVCPELPGLDQTDTDRDGVGDACDVCPMIGDSDQADGDGDGVGDACEDGARYVFGLHRI